MYLTTRVIVQAKDEKEDSILTSKIRGNKNEPYED